MSKTTTKESNIEAAVVRYAKSQGVLAYKFVSPAQKGVPDRLFVYGGNVLFVEFKRPGNKPTQLQFYHLSQLREVGGVNAAWCDSIEIGKTLIDGLLCRNICS